MMWLFLSLWHFAECVACSDIQGPEFNCVPEYLHVWWPSKRVLRDENSSLPLCPIPNSRVASVCKASQSLQPLFTDKRHHFTFVEQNTILKCGGVGQRNWREVFFYRHFITSGSLWGCLSTAGGALWVHLWFSRTSKEKLWKHIFLMTSF